MTPWKQFEALAEKHGALVVRKAFWRGWGQGCGALCAFTTVANVFAMALGLQPLPLWSVILVAAWASAGLVMRELQQKRIEENGAEATGHLVKAFPKEADRPQKELN